MHQNRLLSVTSLVLSTSFVEELIISKAFANELTKYSWNQFRGPTADGKSPSKTYPQNGMRPGISDGRHLSQVKHGQARSFWRHHLAFECHRRWTTTFPLAINLKVELYAKTSRSSKSKNQCFVIHLTATRSPTPVVANGSIFVHYGSAGTACIDTETEEVLWARQDLPCDHHRGPGSSPIFFEDKIILTFDGFDQQYVVALDAKTVKNNLAHRSINSLWI